MEMGQKLTSSGSAIASYSTKGDKIMQIEIGENLTSIVITIAVLILLIALIRKLL